MSRTPPLPIRFVQLERQEACPCSLPLLEQLDRLSGLSADEGNPDVHPGIGIEREVRRLGVNREPCLSEDRDGIVCIVNRQGKVT